MLAAAPSAQEMQTLNQDWPSYGGTPEGTHYSSLDQINRGNVQNLTIAWSFDTGEQGGLQSSPMVVDGILFGITPTQKIFALNAANGTLIWKFDSGITGTQPDRGLAYWTDGKDRRILAGVMNFVYALNAKTGKPVKTFGLDGRIDLREGLGREPASEQSIYLTSPPVVFKGLFIVGGRNPETLPAPPGDIRAFDIHTGKLRWTFHTIRTPEKLAMTRGPGPRGRPAAPQIIGPVCRLTRNEALSTSRPVLPRVIFTGSTGLEMICLQIPCWPCAHETGERIWHFQGVRHDLWDRDFPSPPVLLSVTRDGKKIEAVAQTSKQGFVYVFDRANGRPLFPIAYHSYPTSDVAR